MKKILTIAAFLIAAIAFPQKINAQVATGASSAQLQIVSSKTPSGDIRSMALANVFSKYNSPLVDATEAYITYADKYNIDWKLLPSISGLESTFGKYLMPNSHNAYGWGGGHIYFESWEEGIETISRSLKTNYVDSGAKTVGQIGSMYAESTTWAVRVQSFMNEFNKEYLKLSQANLVTI